MEPQEEKSYKPPSSQRILISSGIPSHETHFYDQSKLLEVSKRVSDKYLELTITKAIESIVVTGLSGSIVGAVLLANHGIPVIHVRKPEEKAHGSKIQGVIKENFNYAIVDDLISSGTTIKHILWNMENRHPNATCKVIILYRDENTDLESFDYCGKDIPIVIVPYPY